MAFGRWTLFIPKLTQLGRSWHGKPDTRPNLKASFPGNSRKSYSVSGGSTTLRGHVVVAASTVPESASEPMSHEEANAAPSPPIPDTRSVAQLQALAHTPSPTHSVYGRNFGDGSSGDLSIQSRASERLSRITNSRESLRALVGQPSQFHDINAAYRQFGRGPDPSRSRERLSRPSSPMNRHATHHWQTSHLETVTTDLPTSPAQGDGEVGLVVQPSASSRIHDPLDPSPTRENSTSIVVVNIQSPSTESLPITSQTIPPQFPDHDEPLAPDTAHSSPVSASAGLYSESSLLSPTASSSVISDFFLPEGRIPQLIHSEQIPRYTKSVKIPRKQKPYDIEPLTTTFP
ncbi:hypothetical protein BC827DRAFT_1195871 [Russula dissimulans]|nr:hypothetical protein BC827DRAFT_1195871 [Russula dissimulans]